MNSHWKNTIEGSKKQLREEARLRRQSISAVEFVHRQNQLIEKLADFLTKQMKKIKPPVRWGLFQGLSDEPNLSQIENSFPNIEIYYPRMLSAEKAQQSLIFSRNPQKTKGAFGVLEPVQDPQYEINLSEMSGLFVPGVAFDRSGHRLGRGKGFYDKALSNFPGLKVGICFEFQIVDSVPVESHDVSMDYIITNKELILINGE